jgi:hypothetical protein
MIIEPQPLRRPAHDAGDDADLPADIWQIKVTVQASTATYMGAKKLGWAEIAGVVKTFRPEVLSAFKQAVQQKVTALDEAADNGASPAGLRVQAEKAVEDAKAGLIAAALAYEAAQRALAHAYKIVTAAQAESFKSSPGFRPGQFPHS